MAQRTRTLWPFPWARGGEARGAVLSLFPALILWRELVTGLGGVLPGRFYLAVLSYGEALNQVWRILTWWFYDHCIF